MNTLFITERYPYPLNEGGNIRTFHILKNIALHHKVTLLTSKNPTLKINSTIFKNLNIKIILLSTPPQDNLKSIKYIFQSLIGSVPYPINKNFSKQILAGIHSALAQQDFDFIHFNHLDTAQYITHLSTNAHTVFDTHNILSILYERLYKTEKNLVKKLYIRTQWLKMVKFEHLISKKIDLCLTCSDSDRNKLLKICNTAQIAVIPNGVDTEFFNPTKKILRDKKKFSIIFTGSMDYFPNEDGILHFHQNIFPLIKRKIPNINLILVGKNPSTIVKQLGKEKNIIVTGAVEDIRPYMEKSDVFIVPLRIGSGTRLKILEAMAMKKPIVSTAIGAEGINYQNEKNIIIAESNEDMARAIIELYNNPQRCVSIGKKALHLVKTNYKWEQIGIRLIRVYEKLL